MKKLTIMILLALCISCDQSGAVSSTTTEQTNFEGWFQSSTVLGIQDENSKKQFLNSLAPVKNLLATNFYVILDGSGSMDDGDCAGGSKKTIVAKKALEEFSKVLPKEYNLGLMAFDLTGTNERLPLGLNNRNDFIQAVQNVGANSGTPLRSAIEKGLKRLAIQANRQSGYGEYHLVLVTDGDPSVGEDPTSIVRYTVANTPVIIHTLGFCIGTGHVLNTSSVDYKPATNPEELVKGLKEVITESSNFSL